MSQVQLTIDLVPNLAFPQDDAGLAYSYVRARPYCLVPFRPLSPYPELDAIQSYAEIQDASLGPMDCLAPHNAEGAAMVAALDEVLNALLNRLLVAVLDMLQAVLLAAKQR